jgi:starch-binding outer membrane protein, SusD/RagB family
LPASYSGADVGRATKGAALTCLMEAYMFDSKWTEAAAAAKQVMGLGYILLPKYSDLWKYGNKETQESIFEVHFGSANGSNFAEWSDSDFPPTNGGGTGYAGWGGFYTPQQQLVNEYEVAVDANNDGIIESASKFDPSTITALFDVNQYKNRDPRLAASIWYNKVDYFGVPYDPNWFDLGSGYHWKKGNSAPATAFPFGTPDYNTIIYRYAYVKLGYAESQNEAVGPDASVYKEVNDVRNRAGMPSLAAGLSKDQMREAIRHERRVEFAGENHRYEDLRRWGLWKSAIENRGKNNGRQTGNLTIADFRNLWPIPKSEMDANPNMVQNPGYK